MFVYSPMRSILRPRPGQRAVFVAATRTLSIYDSKVMRGACVADKKTEAPAVDIFFTPETKTITVNLHERKGSAAIALPLLFRLQPQQGYALIHELMDGRNRRIKSFYWRLWFDEDFESSALSDPSFPINKGVFFFFFF